MYEGEIKGAITSITIEQSEKILLQMKTSICKISGKNMGTGFFCDINLEGKNNHCLMTNYHVIDPEFIKENKIIKISMNDDSIIEEIQIKEKDILFISQTQEYDLIIIKLNYEYNYINYLKLDSNLFNKNSEKGYNDQSIYILHYPNATKAAVSFGYGALYDSKYDILHKCNTQNGSSGGPILKLSTNEVIGIHKGFISSKGFNMGSLLKFPLSLLINNIEIKKKQKNDNNKMMVIGNKEEEIISKPLIKSRHLAQIDFDNIYMTGIGIINLGKTSFINSCLQSLIHCKLFMNSFFKISYKLNAETTPISYNFLLICILMLDITKKTGQKYIDISFFINIFDKKQQIYQHHYQNNSKEFCQIFLEELSYELNEAKKGNLYRKNNVLNELKQSKILQYKNYDLFFKERNKSIIIDLFDSQIISTFICECGYEIYIFGNLFDFTFVLPENGKSIDIIELIKIYFKEKFIHIETKCNRCNTIQIHKKIKTIVRPPEILIIFLERMNEITQKMNECIVTFPDVLNLYNFIDHDFEFDKESYYQLFSVINYQRNTKGGIYYTYVKPLRSKNWFEFNNDIVRQIKVDNNIFLMLMLYFM